MKYKQLIICTAAAFIVLFGFGGLWHFIFFSDYYFHNPQITVARRPAKVGYIAFGELTRALAMAWLFIRIYSQGTTAKAGAKFGLMTGFMGAGLMAFVNYGVVWFPVSWIYMETVFALLQGMLGGWVLALVNRKQV